MSLTKKKVIFKKIYLVKWAVSSSKCRCINKSIGVISLAWRLLI